MRKIKFRAWDGLNIIYDFWIDSKTGIPHQQWYEDMDRISGAKIMQFTGLCDKNGIKVYEGDIIRTCQTYVDIIDVVEFRNGSFWFACVLGEYDDRCSCEVEEEDIEVIGNIYENKAILERCKQQEDKPCLT